MKSINYIWKKLIAVFAVIILMMMIFMERSNTGKVLDGINQQAEACKRHSESLSTQLAGNNLDIVIISVLQVLSPIIIAFP